MKIFVTFFLLYWLHYEAVKAQTEAKPSIWYLRDAHSNFTVDSLLKKNAEFVLIKNAGQNWGHDNVPYWFRISMTNKSDKIEKKLVEVGYAYLDEVTIFVVKNEQLLYKSTTVGWQIPYRSRPLKHYNPIFSVPIDPQSTQTIYLRVYRRILTISAPINIWNEDQFYENDSTKKILWGAFGGILFFVFLIGLILFIELRKNEFSEPATDQVAERDGEGEGGDQCDQDRPQGRPKLRPEIVDDFQGGVAGIPVPDRGDRVQMPAVEKIINPGRQRSGQRRVTINCKSRLAAQIDQCAHDGILRFQRRQHRRGGCRILKGNRSGGIFGDDAGDGARVSEAGVAEGEEPVPGENRGHRQCRHDGDHIAVQVELAPQGKLPDPG